VQQKQTVNGKFYKDVIKILIARVHRVRSEFKESGSWYHLHDNAPAHSSGFVSEFLAKRGIPCYPLQPTPLIYHRLILFPKLKVAMKGTRFEAVLSIQQIVTRELKAIREEAFYRVFDSLYERYKVCAEAAGDCID
jgi:hypothetical protein